MNIICNEWELAGGVKVRIDLTGPTLMRSGMLRLAQELCSTVESAAALNRPAPPSADADAGIAKARHSLAQGRKATRGALTAP